MIAKWAQEDLETLDNLLNNNNSLTYGLKKIGKVFTSKFVGTVPLVL